MNVPIPASLFDPAALPLPQGANPAALLHAGTALMQLLAKGQAIDAAALRRIMEGACGASDAAGAWVWKDAYEACEAAQILFLRRFGSAMRAKAATPAAMLAMLARITGLFPTQTRRSEESQALQQFSTPCPLGFVAATAAALTPADVVLEPSAGTGMLAIFAELAGARLVLNELAETRAGLLRSLFAGVPVTRYDGEQINDRLAPGFRPSVVLMNPPFSASHRVEGRHAAATGNHVRSAFLRLPPGGRLVALTGEGFASDRPSAREAFERLVERGARVVFSAGIAGNVYAKHGTTAETRLTVIDRASRAELGSIATPVGVLPDTAALLDAVADQVPPRLPAAEPTPARKSALASLTRKAPARATAARPAPALPLAEDIEDIAYDVLESLPGELYAPAALYEPYTRQTICIPGAQPHPTKLVQTAAMASVAPPKPGYRPRLPARVVADGLLSDAQLETVIYAGEAHSAHLTGWWTLDETADNLAAAAEEAPGAVRYRQGYFLGDGTGAGKGRQVAGVILDNWLQGRRKALWVSKSDTLLEDAQRDWGHLGQERLQIVPLSRFTPGKAIPLADGILFTTFSTLRGEGRDGKGSRLDQIIEWLGPDFDGVIALDEAHALANAGASSGDRGTAAASQQGRAGLRLQYRLPKARVLYVSATGAVTVQKLAYAHRLGLWGGGSFPFATRADFVAAMEDGGLAAMEVLARDLKALGLYTARSLSYEGVAVEMLDHALTPEQVAIYDAYADAFQIIHQNLTAALQAANITGPSGTLNRQAKSAARSAFESNKQRFFNHLLTAMKCPSLIRSIEQDLAAGHAAVVQIVSTGEALMERRIADIPAEEWGDLQVDITPREYVCDYLAHSFPTQLFEPYTDAEGNLLSRPAFDENGQPVHSREAVERKEAMIEHLAALPPVQAALDQIIHHFGTDVVAEVTGRSRRIIRQRGEDGEFRLILQNRPGSANIGETQAFQDDQKRILVFSDAGGTGRSYHADLGAKNQRLRVHYLLEGGWKADNAIQGLGRTNRTNQTQPPLFRPVTTHVKGEKRFLSTIARRLDTLGAITRGQRETGGQGLFRPEDNLEGPYAAVALRQLYQALYAGRIEGCSLGAFQDLTGLDLTDRDGSLREDLPGISKFLNRCLALRITMQNRLFEAFEERLESVVEGAIASGTYDVGLEVLTAESFRVTERRVAYTHAKTGAQTLLLDVAERRKISPLPLDEALDWARAESLCLMTNAKTGRAALLARAASETQEDGAVIERVRLIRPMTREAMPRAKFAGSHWRETTCALFSQAWEAEIAGLPPFEDRTFHMVTGLLLPIWDRLPGRGMRVYRLVTDDGERIVGRLISPEVLDGVCQNLGIAAGEPLEPAAAWTAVLERGTTLHLAGGLQVRRAQVMGARRVEVSGFEASTVPKLKALGLQSEIIAWKLRLFIPVNAQAATILGALTNQHPLLRSVAAPSAA